MLTQQDIKKLTRVSSLRPLMDISAAWMLIGGCLWLCHGSLWFLPIAMPVIASRLHALTILMHDGAHYLLHPHRMTNDLISNIFCSFPLQISTEAYRKTHNWHHSHTQTMEDPNYRIMRRENSWNFPKPKLEVKRILWRDLFILTMKDHMVILKDWQVLPNFKNIGRLEQVTFPLFALALGAAVWASGLWREFIILQVSAFLINPIVRIRAMSEHIHSEAEGQSKIAKLHETTTINANLLERFFIAPLNTSRHLEHHSYPTVPYYNLEKVHALISQSPMYKEHCRFELDGYFFGKRTSLNEVLSITEEVVGEKKAA